MKKLVFSLLALCLSVSLLLTSCAGKEPPADGTENTENVTPTTAGTPEPSETNESSTPLETSSTNNSYSTVEVPSSIKGVGIVRIAYAHNTLLFEELGEVKLTNYTSIVRIQNESELSALLDIAEVRTAVYPLADFDASEWRAAYDASFFENHALLVVNQIATSGSHRFCVTGTRYDEITDTLTVEIDMYAPMTQTADMAAWLMFVPVDKEAVDAETVRVSITMTDRMTSEYPPSIDGVNTAGIPYTGCKALHDKEDTETLSNHTSIFRIRNEVDFSELLAEVAAYNYPSTSPDESALNVSRWLTTYDASFFENQSLLVIGQIATSGSHRFRVVGVVYDDETDTLTVDVERYNPYGDTMDMAAWLIFVPVDFAGINAENVNVSIVSK